MSPPGALPEGLCLLRAAEPTRMGLGSTGAALVAQQGPWLLPPELVQPETSPVLQCRGPRELPLAHMQQAALLRGRRDPSPRRFPDPAGVCVHTLICSDNAEHRAGFPDSSVSLLWQLSMRYLSATSCKPAIRKTCRTGWRPSTGPARSRYVVLHPRSCCARLCWRRPRPRGVPEASGHRSPCVPGVISTATG